MKYHFLYFCETLICADPKWFVLVFCQVKSYYYLSLARAFINPRPELPVLILDITSRVGSSKTLLHCYRCNRFSIPPCIAFPPASLVFHILFSTLIFSAILYLILYYIYCIVLIRTFTAFVIYFIHLYVTSVIVLRLTSRC